MTPTRTTRGPISGMLRVVVVASLAGSLAAPVIGWSAKGEKAGYSAFAGALTASTIMLIGLLAMMLIIQGDEKLSLAGAFVVYIGQLITLVGVLVAVRDQGWLDGPAFVVAVAVQTVILQAAQIVGYSRARHEIYPGGAR